MSCGSSVRICRAVALHLAWTTLLASGACACPERTNYAILVGGAPSTARSEPNWNGVTAATGPDGAGNPSSVRVLLPPDVVPAREMIEIFDGERRIEVSGTAPHPVAGLEADVGSPPGACPEYAVDYDLAFLPDGEYLMVHRLSSVPAGVTPYDYPITTFDGERAVVTTLVLTAPAASPDAGAR